MILIPTCTDKFNKNFFHLTSPSKKKPTILGEEFTIIDCHTFYLRKFNRNKDVAFAHYQYYTDFIYEHQNNQNMVFVYPDWDWLKDDLLINKLQEYWLTKNIKSSNFLLTDTPFFKNESNIGIAGTHKWVNEFKVRWKHKFGNTYYKNIDSSILYTYDSQIANDKSLIDEKLLRSAMLSIQTML